MKRIKTIIKTIRIAGIICGILMFRPIYGWMEDNRAESFQRWFAQDNCYWYNRPWDFGPTGSFVYATIIVVLFISFVWIFTEKK